MSSAPRKLAFLTMAIVLLVLMVAMGRMWMTRGEKEAIRARYNQMSQALLAMDTNAIWQLIAPQSRARFDRPDLLQGFAKPLNDQSSIGLSGTTARVTPRRLWHYMVIPGGHDIEMIKVEGEWYFTGKVAID